MDTDNFNAQSMLTAFRSESGPSQGQRDRLRQRLGASIALLPAAASSDVLAATGDTAVGSAASTGAAALAKTGLGAGLLGKLAVGSGLSGALLAGALVVSGTDDSGSDNAAPDGAEDQAINAGPLAPEVEGPDTRPAKQTASEAAETQPLEVSQLDLDQLRAETALLQRARRALESGRPALAERALDEHARRFAKGALRPERAALRRTWACVANQTGARQAARRFLATHPQHQYAAGLRQACALKHKSQP